MCKTTIDFRRRRRRRRPTYAVSDRSIARCHRPDASLRPATRGAQVSDNEEWPEKVREAKIASDSTRCRSKHVRNNNNNNNTHDDIYSAVYTAPAICESSFGIIWTTVGQRQVTANSPT